MLEGLGPCLNIPMTDVREKGLAQAGLIVLTCREDGRGGGGATDRGLHGHVREGGSLADPTCQTEECTLLNSGRLADALFSCTFTVHLQCGNRCLHKVASSHGTQARFGHVRPRPRVIGWQVRVKMYVTSGVRLY